ncbi:MAG: hypothetical protein KDB02_05310 [Acidimicrobiales bacterium]|nr:hypothetical protein [Acidimicrobiales bacterium]
MMKRLFLAAAAVMLLAACNPKLIDDPVQGQIVDAGTMVVSGSIPENLDLGGTLTVNGIATTVNGDRTWSQTIPTSPVGDVTVVQALYTEPDGTVHRQETAVVAGPHLAPGEFSQDGVGMNFTAAGLANLGPIINKLAGGSFDISGMILAQDPLIPPTDAGSGVTITGKAYEAGSAGVTVAATPTDDGVKTHIEVQDLYLGLDLQLSGFISGPCKLELQVPSTTIDATFDFAPDGEQVDVNMIGAPVVDTTDVSYEFISGKCDPSTPIVGSIINSQAGGAIEGTVKDGFSSQLVDPDGSGPADSPIADAIETALAGVSVAGPVGDAVQAHLNAPFTAITESNAGIDFRANADFYATKGTNPGDCNAPLLAPNLANTFDTAGTYPTLGGTTPSGQPYGLGLVISSSAFNQMLGAMTECGLLNQEITEIALGGAPIPITSSVLAGMVPEFGSKLPANTPMFIRIVPVFSPYLTADQGPNGETAELMLADLRVSFVQPLGTGEKTWLTLAIDSPLGFDMAFNAAEGLLAPTITAPPSSAVTARLIDNEVGTDESALEAFFPNLFPMFIGGLSDSFAAFPLPSFLGLQLDVVEMARQGNSFVLYANLNPTPQTQLENVVVEDLSTADFNHDDLTFNSWEWRHRLRKTVSSNEVKVKLAGMIGADACCTVDDEWQTAHAGYRVSMDVAAPEPTSNWKLDMTSFIKGAHRAVSEGVGGGFGAQSNISKIYARYQVDGGAWQDFNFDVGNDYAAGADPNETTPWQGGWCGCSFHEPFTGSSTASLNGTGNHSVVVEFSFDVTAWSDSNWAFPAEAGNESAVVFGANDSLTNNFTAGDYPGQGDRDIAADGHFGTITLTPLA